MPVTPAESDVRPGRPIRPDQPATRTARPAHAGVAVLLAVVLLAGNLRAAVSSVPPLLDRAAPDLGLTPVLIGLLGALPALAFALAGWLGARLLRRRPAEHLAIGVLLLTAAGLLARPWAGSATGFLALTGATLLAMGVGNVILPPLVKAWFPTRVGVVSAAYVSSLCLGTAIPALVAVPIATRSALDWQLGLAMWSATALLAAPFWLTAARHPRTVPDPLHRDLPRVPVHRSRIAWGLALLFATNSLTTYAMITWLPVRLVDAGASEARAGTMLAVYTGVGLVPSLLMPVLATRVRRTDLLVAACVVAAVAGYAGLLLAPNALTPLTVSLAGLGAGSFPLALTLVGLRSATPATAGALSGFMQGVGYAVAATGPLLVGVLRELSGGWTSPFAFLGLALVAMLVGGRLSAAQRTVDEELAR